MNNPLAKLSLSLFLALTFFGADCGGGVKTADQLCVETGGTWDVSSCPPACWPPACGEDADPPCTYQCGAEPVCRCTATKPFWRDGRGCTTPSQCPPPTYCGDGYCTGSENRWNCTSDCSWCGDGYCDTNESEYSCSTDCGAASYCGDGYCDYGEDSYNCPTDCGVASYCGDGYCDSGENSYSCPADCGSPAYCGNGYCDIGESRATCPSDCF